MHLYRILVNLDVQIQVSDLEEFRWLVKDEILRKPKYCLPQLEFNGAQLIPCLAFYLKNTTYGSNNSGNFLGKSFHLYLWKSAWKNTMKHYGPYMFYCHNWHFTLDGFAWQGLGVT